MIPAILSETLATLRGFDPNGDWHMPDLPDDDADLLDWEAYYQETLNLTHAARCAMLRVKQAAKR